MSAELALPARLLMGSGPSCPDPRVLRVMATPLVGQFDPAFTGLMAETQELLREAFRRARHDFPTSVDLVMVPRRAGRGMPLGLVAAEMDTLVQRALAERRRG